MSTMYDDLEATRTAVTTITDQQNTLAKEQFEMLAKKCRDELRRAVSEKAEVTQALGKAKRSLAKLQIELEVVRTANVKLQSQKSVVADDVSHLRSEISELLDQKKLLERQLSQNETLAREKDRMVHQLESEQHKLRSQLQASEKNWTNRLSRHEREWQDRMAEMNLVQENLAEEKDDLMHEKEVVEERLAEVVADKKELEEGKRHLESKVGELEAKITEMEVKLAGNAAEISRVQRGIAKVVVERACSAARTSIEREHEREEFELREDKMRTQTAALVDERDTLNESLQQSLREKNEMEELSKGAREKEAKIKELTAQLDSLMSENKAIQAEIRSLRDLRQSAVDDLQQLSEAKQSLQLENQKIHMQLSTEISVLQTKLKSVEDEKQALEARVADLSVGGRGGGGSAFQGLPGATEGGYAEGLRRQVTALQAETQQLRRENSELRERKVECMYM